MSTMMKNWNENEKRTDKLKQAVYFAFYIKKFENIPWDSVLFLYIFDTHNQEHPAFFLQSTTNADQAHQSEDAAQSNHQGPQWQDPGECSIINCF